MTEKNLVSDFIAFLNESCTAFHSVEAAKKRFLGAGFIEINESEEWRLIIGKSYFFIRNGTTIMAFTVGNGYVPGNGFTVIGAHTDSPCFKIKPNPTSKKSEALMLNTQPYGGGLWHTWFDRDLGLAGRVIIRAADGSLESRLFRIDTPISRIPTLAIHLTSGSEREHFAPNLQENAKALLTIDPAILSMKADTEGSGRFHPYLVQIIADNLGVNKASVVDMEIQLIDTQPSLIGGGASDFVFSGRLDNLCSSYQSLAALISSTGTLAAQKNICIAMLFDHEEVGSNSLNGAGSSLFMDTLRSLNLALADGSHGSIFIILSFLHIYI